MNDRYERKKKNINLAKKKQIYERKTKKSARYTYVYTAYFRIQSDTNYVAYTSYSNSKTNNVTTSLTTQEH